MTVEPEQLEDEDEVESELAALVDEVHVLGVGARIATLQHFFDYLHLPGKLVRLLKTDIIGLYDLLDPLLNFPIFLRNTACTEC